MRGGALIGKRAPRSDRLADLTHDGLPIWSHANELRDVLIELERSSNPVALYARVQNDGSDSPFYRSGALPAVLAELLLAGDHPNPHGILGAHTAIVDGVLGVVIRALVPNSDRVECLLEDGRVLVNDLARSRFNYLAVWLACHLTTRSRVVRFDGPASVRSAFTPAEARALAERAGLSGATVSRRFPCRFLLSWSRP